MNKFGMYFIYYVGLPSGLIQLSEIATALGILVDKFTKNEPDKSKDMTEILKNITIIDDIVRIQCKTGLKT